MTSRHGIRIIAALLVVEIATLAVHGGPPAPLPRPAPGILLQDISTQNLGPYVVSTSYRFGEFGRTMAFTSISWFNADGTLRRELSGSAFTPNRGVVFESTVGSQIAHGLFEDWKIEIPKKGERPGGLVNATADSRVFHQNFHPEAGKIAVDVYLHGKLEGTVGPYYQYRAGDARLNRYGHAGMLTRESADGALQVVVFDEHARVRFTTRCDDPTIDPAVTPDADGVLLQANTGEQPPRFAFYNASGKVRSLALGPNARLLDWVPGTHRAVFETSIGYDKRYRVVDWDNGKTLWDIANPCPRVNAVSRSVVALADYVLTCGAEYSGTEHPVIIPTLYAIGAESGTVVAKWQPNFSGIVSTDGGGLLQLNDKLYFISQKFVSELHVEEIASKSNGWESP